MIVTQAKLVSEFVKAFGFRPEGPDSIYKLWDFAEGLGLQVQEDAGGSAPARPMTHAEREKHESMGRELVGLMARVNTALREPTLSENYSSPVAMGHPNAPVTRVNGSPITRVNVAPQAPHLPARCFGRDAISNMFREAAGIVLKTVELPSPRLVGMHSDDIMLSKFVTNVFLTIRADAALNLYSEQESDNPLVRSMVRAWAQVLGQHFYAIHNWPGTFPLAANTLKIFRMMVQASGL